MTPATETAPVRRQRSALDYAIWAVVILTLAAAAWLGWSVYSGRQTTVASTPASRAIDDLSAIVKKSPKDPKLRNRLAEALLAAGRTDEGIGQFKTALTLDPKNVDAMTGLGLVAMRTKRFADAEVYWKRIIGLLEGGSFEGQDNRLEAAYYYQGLVLLETKRPSQAIGYLKQALRIHDSASDTHYALSVAYGRSGRKADQKKELKITLALDPKMPEANYDLGLIALAEGDRAAAADFFRTSADAAKEASKPEAALAKLGPVEARADSARKLIAAKRFAAALVEARIAAALAPSDVALRLLLAQAYEKAGNKAVAIKVYRAVLDAAPDDRVATAALKRLGSK